MKKNIFFIVLIFSFTSLFAKGKNVVLEGCLVVFNDYSSNNIYNTTRIESTLNTPISNDYGYKVFYDQNNIKISHRAEALGMFTLYNGIDFGKNISFLSGNGFHLKINRGQTIVESYVSCNSPGVELSSADIYNQNVITVVCKVSCN